jgi:hypothetical protein
MAFKTVGYTYIHTIARSGQARMPLLVALAAAQNLLLDALSSRGRMPACHMWRANEWQIVRKP